ncbi:TlpA family protein disulfide reductase [Chloroflexi bacterium TSY]|nr:TlpA family protein disulfide reductase [Chloroflexi bacterium TSY]
MKTKVCTVLLIFLVAALLTGCVGGREGQLQDNGNGAAEEVADANASKWSDSATTAADLATNFTMQTLSGEELSLVDLRGQFVLVNFWATWCVPCRKEMPYFQALADEHSEELVVLGINMREDAERIQPFVDEMGITFPILLDPPNDLLLEHNVRGLPVSYVVGPDGTIVYRRIGGVVQN